MNLQELSAEVERMVQIAQDHGKSLDSVDVGFVRNPREPWVHTVENLITIQEHTSAPLKVLLVESDSGEQRMPTACEMYTLQAELGFGL